MQKIKSQRRITGKLKARLGRVSAIALTDATRFDDPLQGLHHVPAHSLIIVRDYQARDRLARAETVMAAARQRDWLVAIAGDADLARHVGADGVHLPEYQLGSPPYTLPILSAACHTRHALFRAQQLAVPLALVSPVFPTNSHKGARVLGVHRLQRQISGLVGPKIIALGGINRQTLKQLRSLNRIDGFAAIDGWHDTNLSKFW